VTVTPGRGAPAILHRLHRRAVFDVRTAWRLKYGIPINDPRYLAVTEAEALTDLVEARYREHADRLAVDPGAVQEENAVQPEAIAAMDALIAQESARDWKAELAKLKRVASTAPPITAIRGARRPGG